jgi:Arc/MetJ-type ribon-helix-helix transcriptional regulator
MNINLPEDLAAVVRKRVEERGYPSADEYVASLIRADDTDEWWASLTDEQRREHDRLEARIKRALASGPPLTLEEARAEILRQREERRAGRAASPNSP